MSKIKTLVVPCAGLGTRSLPQTKSVPKEVLPIANKPAIQWIVEEAVAAGIEKVVLILSTGKSIIADHFDRHLELESVLRKRGKYEDLAAVRKCAELADIVSVRQQEPLGLGHAILCAKPALTPNEPFAVILPDELFFGELSGLQQIIDSYAFVSKKDSTKNGILVSLTEVPENEINKYGIVEVDKSIPQWALGMFSQYDYSLVQYPLKLKTLIEKPPVGSTESRLAITGRYVLPYEILDILEKADKGTGGEIQLTDSILSMLRLDYFVGGVMLEGERYDVGRQLDWILANIKWFLDGANAKELNEFNERLNLLKKRNSE